MSFAELREQVAGLSARERLQLSAILADLKEQNDAEFRAESIRTMDAGGKITAAEFERRHNQFQDKALAQTEQRKK